ncbi:hypothetical protein FBALC1_04372 [Flavobacteriales bacterium ALC-1]|nr:hypothetical protein FBALC1_04372 [Flavobacteriales bacterium ALC-1]
MKKHHENMLEEWDRRVSRAVLCHYESAKILRKYHLCLGIPSILIIAILGSFASFGDITMNIEEGSIFWTQLIFIILTITSAILVGLQTFLNFSQRAEKHRDDAGEYGTIRREIEQIAVTEYNSEKELNEKLNELRGKLDILSKTTREIPNNIWKDHKKKYTKGKYKSTIFN